MSKTKPHGYTFERDPIKKLSECDWIRVWPFENKDAGETTPICLISPATCDKVREFVEAMRKRDLNQSEIYYAAELLKLLPEAK